MEKKAGGLGLKDLKVQGIALVAKWIFHALEGNEPWKVLIRNNITFGTPKMSTAWKSLSFCNLVASGFPVSVSSPLVFKSIWRAWEVFRCRISNNRASSNDLISGERSI